MPTGRCSFGDRDIFGPRCFVWLSIVSLELSEINSLWLQVSVCNRFQVRHRQHNPKERKRAEWPPQGVGNGRGVSVCVCVSCPGPAVPCRTERVAKHRGEARLSRGRSSSKFLRPEIWGQNNVYTGNQKPVFAHVPKRYLERVCPLALHFFFPII